MSSQSDNPMILAKALLDDHEKAIALLRSHPRRGIAAPVPKCVICGQHVMFVSGGAELDRCKQHMGK